MDPIKSEASHPDVQTAPSYDEWRTAIVENKTDQVKEWLERFPSLLR